jgi:hypothetical protein
MAAGMHCICRYAVTMQSDGEEDLVYGIGGGMRGFRKHARGMGSESRN